MTDSRSVSPEILAEIFDRLRASSLHVHALTSGVAAERTANTLLALGVRPSLTFNPEEVPAFVAKADALLINLGMHDPIRELAINKALKTALDEGKRWVLDPVFVDLSRRRRSLAEDLIVSGPTVLKTNQAEAALADLTPPATIRVITGPSDQVTWGERHLSIANDHPMARQVTAMGCALGAVIAAFLAVEDDAFLATAAALTVYGIAGDLAARVAAGPGSFAAAFLDALSAIDGKTVIEQAKFA